MEILSPESQIQQNQNVKKLKRLLNFMRPMNLEGA